MSFWKSITWQAWKRPIEIPSIYKEYNPSQKSLATLRRKPSPASPLSMLLQWCRLFFRYFFEPAKQHWAGGMGVKEATVQCYCLRLWVSPALTHKSVQSTLNNRRTKYLVHFSIGRSNFWDEGWIFFNILRISASNVLEMFLNIIVSIGCAIVILHSLRNLFLFL